MKYIQEYLYSLATDKRKGVIAGILKVFLLILSLIYGLVVRVLSFVYRFKPYRLNCKVISVGNITLGGTGKTPLAEMLAKELTSKGHRIAILIRGYASWGLVRTSCADEPILLTHNLPGVHILVGRDRYQTGKEAIERYGVDTIILDDGFQYWCLFRDLDIVAIDATNPFGNGQTLPRGILREPLSSLKRANILVLTKMDLGKDNLPSLKERLKHINPKAIIASSVHRAVELYDLSGVHYPLSHIQGKDVCIFSGIADPESFEKTLLNLGARPVEKFCFPDHYDYKEEDMRKIFDSCIKSNLDTIITTEKDKTRLPASFTYDFSISLLILRIELQIVENEKDFFNRLVSLYQR
jgi:tetraacyldisaccharide 4'-kinase